jgi:hypothetical protein
MDESREYIFLETVDGELLEGNALLYKSRLSEIFNDNALRFIPMEDVTDASGRKKEKVYINKDMIVWAAPRDLRHSAQTTFFGATEYVEVTVNTRKDVVIRGRINLQVFSNIFDMLRYTGAAPYLVLINAENTGGELYHTLFVNKSAIIQLESGA